MSDSTLRQAEASAADLRALIREAEKALGHAGEAGDKFDDLRERLRGAVSDGGFSLENLRDDVVRRAKQADGIVRDNPYLAIGVAAGIGALIGIVVSRNGRS